MALADIDIKKAIKNKRIIISPAINYGLQLGSCSVDLRLSNIFRVFNHAQVPFIDPRDKKIFSHLTKKIKVISGEAFVIQPGDFVLASTIESIQLANNILGRLEGRSSLGRLGIVVHSTASVFDPGWKGRVVLELGNLGRIAVALYPGMRICSLTFEELSSAAEIPYNKKKHAKYFNQKGPAVSRFFQEFNVNKPTK